jgi:hypothetical protein
MDTITYIEHYNTQSFDWLSWRNGSLIHTLKIPHRESIIIHNKQLLRKLAVGWCEADNIPCRPKIGYVAVMFNTGGDNWWTHLTINEFKTCFPEI